VENEEAAAFHWARPDDVVRMMTDAYASRVLDSLAANDSLSIRAHDGIRLL
jgi:hypothetical protein